MPGCCADHETGYVQVVSFIVWSLGCLACGHSLDHSVAHLVCLCSLNPPLSRMLTLSRAEVVHTFAI